MHYRQLAPVVAAVGSPADDENGSVRALCGVLLLPGRYRVWPRYRPTTDRRGPIPEPKSAKPKRERYLRRGAWKVLVATVLVAGLIVSVASAWAWYAYTSSLRNQAIASSFTGVKSILGTALERDSDLLATVNAEVATHPGLTNPTLTAILSKLDLSQRYPGSFAFTYVESVGNSELSDFESTAQHDPPLGMHQSASAVVKPSLNGRSGYCLTRLVAVELLGEGILKHVLMAWLTPYVSSRFNFCASSFEGLLDTSASTGDSVATSVVSLMQPAPGLPSIPATLHSLLLRLPIFVELSPVYKGTNVPTNVHARNRALIGWTMAIFDADQILSPALGSGKAVSLVLAYAPPGGKRAVLARAGSPQPDARRDAQLFRRPGVGDRSVRKRRVAARPPSFKASRCRWGPLRCQVCWQSC